MDLQFPDVSLASGIRMFLAVHTGAPLPLPESTYSTKEGNFLPSHLNILH